MENTEKDETVEPLDTSPSPNGGEADMPSPENAKRLPTKPITAAVAIPKPPPAKEKKTLALPRTDIDFEVTLALGRKISRSELKQQLEGQLDESAKMMAMIQAVEEERLRAEQEKERKEQRTKEYAEYKTSVEAGNAQRSRRTRWAVPVLIAAGVISAGLLLALMLMGGL